MQKADAIRDIYQKRGSKGLLLERVYRRLFDPELFLRSYGKIYRNAGAMTKGATAETVDGMSLRKIQDIISQLRSERYHWMPVRRTVIPKANGKTRLLGIPTWSDKLVQEALRSLLEPYYEQRFSNHSHGFRPHRSCHSALREIQEMWKGTTWFIEGDIQGCFDNIDHTVLLEIIGRDIRDGRLLQLIDGLLKAGYMEDWRYHETLSGTPQGGIISPLLANIYLNELDRFVEDTLIPAYTRGDHRKRNPPYERLRHQIEAARKRENFEEVKRLMVERRKLISVDPFDGDFRRLHYVRYADDFLLGFAGPKKEAEEIRHRLGEFLEQRLKLTLSVEKTSITHAGDGKANFLGYEITVTRSTTLLFESKGRTAHRPISKRFANGRIALLMPQRVVRKYQRLYSSGGKIRHRAELLSDKVYTIFQRYQSVLRGLYSFYCMAINVSDRMHRIKFYLQTSLAKTLASKLRCSVCTIWRRYQVTGFDLKFLRVVEERPGKAPLVAVFGGFPLTRNPKGLGTPDFRFEVAWFRPGTQRSEVVQRLVAGKCELCGTEGPMQVHHIRKLADINRPGRRPKAEWERIMSARLRKTLVVCEPCHVAITVGKHDGPKL